MLAVGYSTAALACKDLTRPEHLVASWVDAYSDIVVAAVEAIEAKGTGNAVEEMFHRTRPFRARIKIDRSLKGATSPGDIVAIETTEDEEAHAVCPLRLEPGQTYLLLLTRQGKELRVSRYASMTTSLKDPRAATYLQDLELLAASALPSQNRKPSQSRDGGSL
jgi:hypothetical protein